MERQFLLITFKNEPPPIIMIQVEDKSWNEKEVAQLTVP